jgi:hypothetical protein
MVLRGERILCLIKLSSLAELILKFQGVYSSGN